MGMDELKGLGQGPEQGLFFTFVFLAFLFWMAMI